jgi:hypothetical protein
MRTYYLLSLVFAVYTGMTPDRVLGEECLVIMLYVMYDGILRLPCYVQKRSYKALYYSFLCIS